MINQTIVDPIDLVFNDLIERCESMLSYESKMSFENSNTFDAEMSNMLNDPDHMVWEKTTKTLETNPLFSGLINSCELRSGNPADDERISLLEICKNIKHGFDLYPKDSINEQLIRNGVKPVSNMIINEYMRLKSDNYADKVKSIKMDLINIMRDLSNIFKCNVQDTSNRSYSNEINGIKYYEIITDKKVKLICVSVVINGPAILMSIATAIDKQTIDIKDFDELFETVISGSLKDLYTSEEIVSIITWDQIIHHIKNSLQCSHLLIPMPHDKIVTIFPANFPNTLPIEFPANKLGYCKDVIGGRIKTELTESQVYCVSRLLHGDKTLVADSDKSFVRDALREILIDSIEVP